MLTAGVPAAGAVRALACKDQTTCPGSQLTDPLSSTPAIGAYTAKIPTANLDGVGRLCGLVTVINPEGGVHGPLKDYPLACHVPIGPLKQAAGAFKVTPGPDGLSLEGWAVDVSTDGPGTFVVRNGSGPTSPSAVVTADLPDGRSAESMPGFSQQHGFITVVPYTGDPGPTDLCVWLRRTTDATGDLPMGCHGYNEPSEAFATPSEVQQGDPVNFKVRNVGPGAKVNVNLLSDGGYFLQPWSFETWTATAGPDGGADLVIDSSSVPAGEYTLAFHCQPGCPRANLTGSGDWKGDITLSSRLAIRASSASTLTATASSPLAVHVVGAGFPPGQEVRLIVIPHLNNADGPPVEASMVTYPVADTQGAFSIDVDLSGFPLRDTLTQIVAYNSAERPVATVLYSTF